MPVGKDGRVHGTFSHKPSTLRLSMHDPNLMNIPRGNEKGANYGKFVKDTFVCPPGSVFWERDFSGIEAVLVGYFAGSPRYIRSAQLGVHAFFASHLVGQPASWDWDDDRLRRYFADLKAAEPVLYDTAKRCVHGSNYKMTPMKMHYEYPETFRTVKAARDTQGMYYDLFSEIPAWHEDICHRVDGTRRRAKHLEPGEDPDPWALGVCEARNPFGYLHRFYNVLDWEKVEVEGKDEWQWSYGEDAKRLIAFLPQSTAAAIIKRAGKRLFRSFYDSVGHTMRLWIHDAILGEAKEEEVTECLRISKEVMEAPIPQLPLDPTWGMGEFLSIGTEAKVGACWGEMRKAA